MNIKLRVVALFAFLVTCTALPAQGKRSHFSEQMHFSAEETEVKTPVALPPDVLAILRKDEVVRSVLEDANIPAEKIPLSWFSASRIHLSNPRVADLVVMAKGPLAGANVTTFWVFRATAHGNELVLSAPAHDLEVKKTRWKGHQDIEITSMSAVTVSTVLYRFNGKGYTPYKLRGRSIQFESSSSRLRSRFRPLPLPAPLSGASGNP